MDEMTSWTFTPSPRAAALGCLFSPDARRYCGLFCDLSRPFVALHENLFVLDRDKHAIWPVFRARAGLHFY